MIYSPRAKSQMNKSRIHEVPKNNRLIFHMGEVDCPMKNKRFCAMHISECLCMCEEQQNKNAERTHWDFDVVNSYRTNMFCVVSELYLLQDQKT